MLVRVGGPNAGHQVRGETDEITIHHHLPSGTTRSDARLLLAPGCVLLVDDLLNEIADSKVDEDRLSIDPQAMIISPEDKIAEEELVKEIASTGRGVGAATARRVRDRFVGSSVRLAKDEPALLPYIRPAYDVLEDAYRNRDRILLEGTQGTGLSLLHGFYPHVTSRDTTIAGCLSEAGIPPNRVRRTVMVCRTHPIRVQNPPKGSSGPMSQEIDWAEVGRRSGYEAKQLEKQEITSTTRRRRRVGEFDWTLLRKAAALNGPSDIALTFVDHINIANAKARRFEQLTEETIRFIEEVGRVAGCPVSLISTRFHYRSIIDRRTWHSRNNEV